MMRLDSMVLLFSGGVDSYIAWHYLNYPPTVYFNLHTKYSERELRVVQRLIPHTVVEDVLNLGNREQAQNAYIPHRNLHLALLANHYSDTIVIVGLKDDKVSDKNEQVFEKFSVLMSELEGRKITVTSPFWSYTKAQIVAWYLEQGFDKNPLLRTISCYSEDQRDRNYCGKCESCFRKWVAFWQNGIKLVYSNERMMARYYERALKGWYVKERNDSIRKCVEEYSGWDTESQ